MKEFLTRVCITVTVITALVVTLAVATEHDGNAYLCAYNSKLDRLTSTDHSPLPRLILVGGSNLAFGVDSRLIEDSLGVVVVNMGLHGGVGIRYLLNDVIPHLRPTDILVVAMEYGNFFSGGNGEPETLPQFLAAVGWQNLRKLNARQWAIVAAGLPRLAAVNAKRLIYASLGHPWDKPAADSIFSYAASGFNSWGDEVSHWRLPAEKIEPSKRVAASSVNQDFMNWLDDALASCENREGVQVLMLPPVCPQSHFNCCYDESIVKGLAHLGRHYVVPPQAMVVPDSCSYNGGYHVNREGVVMASRRMVTILRPFCTFNQARLHKKL